MRSLFDYMSVMLISVFWFLRVVVCACYAAGKDIGAEPLNFNMEIIILFLMLLFIILLVRRSFIGAVAIFVANGMYYGDFLYQGIINGDLITKENALNALFAIYGIFISVLCVFSVLITKYQRRSDAKDYKTDWFFLNKKFDRKHDKRADENQYKF